MVMMYVLGFLAAFFVGVACCEGLDITDWQFWVACILAGLFTWGSGMPTIAADMMLASALFASGIKYERYGD